MSPKKFGLAAAAIAAAGAVALGGSALANAAGSTGTNVSGYAATASPTSSGSADSSGQDGSGRDGSGQNGTGTGGRGPAAHAHTEVTGDEAAKVSAAVTAKDAGVTVAKVLKDPDGSYDVLGTKGGQPVHFEVSADLATVSQGGPGADGRRPGGPGGKGRPGGATSGAPTTSAPSATS